LITVTFNKSVILSEACVEHITESKDESVHVLSVRSGPDIIGVSLDTESWEKLRGVVLLMEKDKKRKCK